MIWDLHLLLALMAQIIIASAAITPNLPGPMPMLSRPSIGRRTSLANISEGTGIHVKIRKSSTITGASQDGFPEEQDQEAEAQGVAPLNIPLIREHTEGMRAAPRTPKSAPPAAKSPDIPVEDHVGEQKRQRKGTFRDEEER